MRPIRSPILPASTLGRHCLAANLQDLSRDIEVVYRTTLKDAKQLQSAADKCKFIAADLRLLFPEKAQKGNWRQMLARDEVQTQISKLS